MKNFISILLLLFIIVNSIFSQSESKLYCYEYHLPFSKFSIVDSLILYENSTFEFYGHFMSLGLHSNYSKGTYTTIDNTIILNSYIAYKRECKVIEKKRHSKGTKYKSNSCFLSDFMIIEIFENKFDTLQLDFLKDDYISINDKAIGFKMFVNSAYVGEYFFKKKYPRNINIYLGPENKLLFYFKDEKFTKKNNDLIMKYMNQDLIFKHVF